MTNNRTILEKSVEHPEVKKIIWKTWKRKNITRDLSFTEQEPIRMNNTENESIHKDLGNIKVDINDRKNLTMYLNKRVANKLHLVVHLLLRTWRVFIFFT